MTLLFAGNAPTDFGIIPNDNYRVSTTTGFNAFYLDSSMMIKGAGGGSALSPFEIDLNASVSDLWLHFSFTTHGGTFSTSTLTGDFIYFLNAAGNKVAAIEKPSGREQLVINNPARNILNTNNFIFPEANQTLIFDYHLLITQTDITLKTHRAGVEIFSLTAPNNGVSPITKIVFANYGLGRISDNFVYFSEVIVTEAEPTLGMRLSKVNSGALGFYNEWAGDFNSLSDNNFNTAVVSEVPNQRQTSQGTYIGPSSVYPIKLFTNTFAGRGQNAPSNLQQTIRIGGVDYDTPSSPVSPLGFDNIASKSTINPATGIEWTTDDLNAIEIGFKSE